jgi:resuscitation-promoting factor RpfA
MARYRGRHRAPSRMGLGTTSRTIVRTAVAGAVLSAPALAAPAASADTGTTWDRLAQCESSGNWAINTGNGFYGGLQFTRSTWRAFGGTTAFAHQASREQQIAVAERVLAQQGWGAWPACSRKLGLRGTAAPSVAPQARPSTSVASAAPSGGTIRVTAGDTLSSLAAEHDIDGGWTALRAANPSLPDPDKLSIGTLLQLPG